MPVFNRALIFKAVAVLVACSCHFAVAQLPNLAQTTAALSEARSRLAATSVGSKILFAGGLGAVALPTVDIYSVDTQTWTVASLSQPRYWVAATSVGSRALFGGGFTGFQYSAVVDIYDANTNVWSAAALSQGRYQPAATSAMGLALFGGGVQNNAPSNVVDIFDSNTHAWSVSHLSQARYWLAAASVGTKALFAAGFTGTQYSLVVDIYNAATRQWSTAQLWQSRYDLAATAVLDSIAIFAGGQNGGSETGFVDIYHSASGNWTWGIQLSKPRFHIGATTLGPLGLLGGGQNQAGTAFDVIDIFDARAQAWSTGSLSEARSGPAAASAMCNALFGGGLAGNPSAIVDIFGCAPGSFANDTSCQCKPCAMGSYAPDVGLSSCVSCPPATYNAKTGQSSLSSCLKCAIGSFNAQTAQSACSACSPGTYSDRIGQVLCTPCRSGTVLNASGATSAQSCAKCLPGSFGVAPGQSECWLCPPSTYSSAFGAAGSAACQPCLIGHYCPSSGTIRPLECPAGTICQAAGFYLPEPCSAGFYCPTPGAVAAIPCPRGNFCPQFAMIQPRPCPAGLFCPGTHSLHTSACLPGFFCPYMNMTDPLPCLPGHYCPYDFMVNAIPCPPFYAASAGSPQCHFCPDGATADQSECLNANDTCSPGWGKGAAGCAICGPGKFSDGKQPCSLCPDAKYTNINGTVSCLVCNDIGLFCNPSTGTASPLPGFWSFTEPHDRFGALHTVPCLQPTLCLGSVRGQPSVTMCASTRLQSASNVECSQCAEGHSEWSGKCLPCESVNGGLVLLIMLLSFAYVAITHKVSQDQSASGLAAVLMYFAQTALLISGSMTSVAAVSWLSVLNMQAEDTGGLCIGPISPIGKVRLALSSPFLLFAVLVIIGALHFAAHRFDIFRRVNLDISVPAPTMTAYTRSLLAMLLYSFTSLTATTITLLDCQNVSSWRVVALLPAIDCRAPEYLALRTFAIVVLAVAAVVPFAILVFLIVRRNAIRDNEASRTWSILFEPFKTSSFFWTVVILFRRVLYVFCSTIHTATDRYMSFGIVSVLCLVLHYNSKPYVDALTNRLEALSLMLHAILSFVLTAFPNPTPSPAVAAAVFLLVPLPSIVFLVVAAAVALRERLRQRAHKAAVLRADLAVPLVGVNPDEQEEVLSRRHTVL